MVKITFPDGSVREYEQGVTGLQIAESISPAPRINIFIYKTVNQLSTHYCSLAR